jgi:hypothetical protein
MSGSRRSRDALWQRVHAHLDAGRDPLRDAELLDALAADPDLLAQVAGLVDDLGALAATGRTRSPRRAASRALPWILAAAAAAAAVLVGPGPPDGPADRGSSPAPSSFAAGAPERVVGFRASTVERSDGQRIERSVELRPDGRVVARTRASLVWRPPSPPRTDRPEVLSFRAEVTFHPQVSED